MQTVCCRDYANDVLNETQLTAQPNGQPLRLPIRAMFTDITLAGQNALTIFESRAVESENILAIGMPVDAAYAQTRREDRPSKAKDQFAGARQSGAA